MLINSVGSCKTMTVTVNYLKKRDNIISVITSVICITTNDTLKLDVVLFVLRHFATRKKYKIRVFLVTRTICFCNSDIDCFLFYCPISPHCTYCIKLLVWACTFITLYHITLTGCSMHCNKLWDTFVTCAVGLAKRSSLMHYNSQ